MMNQIRRAFYPCCGSDIDEPRHLLAGLVDEIIFCDIRSQHCWEGIDEGSELPNARFEVMDVRNYIPVLPQIRVFFYRRDSTSEGGSGVYILSERWLAQIIEKFDPVGGLIITDGSNRGNGILRKMMRSQGYTKRAWNRHFQLSSHQDFAGHGLIQIEVGERQ